MGLPTKHFYEFGAFRLDTDERILLREGRLVSLTPKSFETLLVLVKNSGRIIDKEELLDKIWPDSIVEEVSLAKMISLLRKTLGEDFENAWDAGQDAADGTPEAKAMDEGIDALDAKCGK